MLDGYSILPLSKVIKHRRFKIHQISTQNTGLEGFGGILDLLCLITFDGVKIEYPSSIKIYRQQLQSFREQMGSHFQPFRSFWTRKIPICSNSHFLANETASFGNIPIFNQTHSFERSSHHRSCFLKHFRSSFSHLQLSFFIFHNLLLLVKVKL